MKIRTRPLLASAIAFIAGLSAVIPAASADKPKLHLERIDVEKYPLITSYITFVESDGRVITGKTKEDFKLIFDSNEQGLAADAKSFDQVAQPIYVVIVAQISGAMHEVFDDEKRGIKQLAQAAADVKGSKVALIAYSQDSKRVAELSKPEELDGAASGLAEDTEGTEVHLLNAVGTAIDMLNAKGVPDNARKVIIIFSDGIDASGTDKGAFAALGKRARQGEIVVDTVGYAPFEPGKLRNLAEIAKQTNGTDRACKSPQEVGAQFSNIADEIKKQYVVLFTSVIAGDFKEHTIQVVNETSGSAIYSNNVNKNIKPGAPPPKPPVPWYQTWWFYTLCALFGVGLLALAAMWWRNREPAVAAPEAAVEAPAPAPASDSAQRTMAIDVGALNKGPTVGWIVGMSGQYTDRTFKLQPSRTVIGSSPEADVKIDDSKMSRKHCEIRFNGVTYQIADLGSTNGIILNDKRVPQGDLVDGDNFRLGGTDFKFKSIN